MKQVRQEKIIEIVKSNSVSTQEELTELLTENGFKATQATVSRDIKELGLVKATDKNGVQRYITPTARAAVSSNHDYIFSTSVISITHAVNDIVIKCYPGMANAACAVLDSMEFGEILGTLAGDDTIFIIAKSENDAIVLTNKLRGLKDA